METIAQAALALLAAAGLLALAWLCFGRLLLPGPWTGAVYAVLPGKGGGGMLEQQVKALLWLEGLGGVRPRIYIADMGLDLRGREIAAGLERRYGVEVCPLGELGERLRNGV
ncbi:hypothetical protein H7U37_03165 [Pseudoflavonifractor phocaeensis]|uniref:hypothetical protein n=1 Tax=Pseudoflavonifractor phocaeensis TaxID=1870988 RepID=UPI00195E9223|nr:hypothetical protein [Pseudoflavonifractor phocaeensis]MBM6869344.1 hypothetical protein [Pseudoflavonifractor phocaeensis]MBM6937529.1 hypothetical protein [Pseudoflavonifractor phocaeensis]